MFGELSDTELSVLLQVATQRHAAAGEVLFEEGDPGDAWYLVARGSVEVCKGASKQVIAVLGPKACFGEMAILDGSPRSARVQVREPTLLICFRRQDFQRLLRDDELAAYKVVHQMSLVLVARQRRVTERLMDVLQSTTGKVRADLLPIINQSAVAE